MSLIDNKNQTLREAIKNALSTSDSVDIAVGYFFFSGFQSLASELKDKKVRIIVGLEIDPTLVSQITQYAKEEDEDLTRWQPRSKTTSRTALKQNYVDSFVSFMNDSDIFDNESEIATYDLYREKIENGTLEIRKTIDNFHGKFYLLHNKSEHSQSGDYPGTIFTGSSNFTYRGLVGQGEINEPSRDKQKFAEYQQKFDELWNDSKSVTIVDKFTKEEFVKELDNRLWRHAVPNPYEVYIRILHELFYQEKEDALLTPSKITKGYFTDLEYQIDAVRIAIDKLNKYSGVILADVVGLGKSIIASAIARNLDHLKTVIIAPPHLIPQWEEYKEQFGIRGSKVFSSGNMREVFARYEDNNEPLLIILDEAHRYRNEDTNDYKLLHQVCRSHTDNKILLLTATPFNNDPKDVFALIKLFQTPGQTTIRSIDNLSLRYRELIQRYKKLRTEMSKGLSQDEIDHEAGEIASEQRRLIEQVIIRRSRLDLDYITRYKEDLKKQNISFAEIKGGGPELLEYELGELTDLYTNTLDLITQPNEEGFTGARYQPTAYIEGDNREKFIDKFKDQLDDVSDLWIAQSNLAKFMRRLLVMRFESSKAAFKSSLEKMIESNERIENWWDNLGTVPIMKKGKLPDPQDYDMEDGEESDALTSELEFLRSKEGFLEIPKEMLSENFITEVRHDTILLKKIREDWFSNPQIADLDPKLTEIASRMKGFLKENPKKKIVIFSVYKDTVDYLYEQLKSSLRVFRYTASDSTSAKRQEVKENFDASVPESHQKDDYDVLIATDALSEGYNLHRAGIVINYDIPYNPTRVIQRVGRINRINKRVFDFLEVYNCFPTAIGEIETRVKSISTLKMKLINAVVGSDTRTLTKDEELVSFFKDEYSKAEKQNEEVSWDSKYREDYDQAGKNPSLMESIMNVPRRARLKRQAKNKEGVVVFGKKGEHAIFTLADILNDPTVVSTEDALNYFHAKPDENAQAVGDDFINVFNLAKDKLFAKHELPKIQGRRAEAIKVLKVIGDSLPQAKDYSEDIISVIKELDDIPEGTLKDIFQLNLKNVEFAYEKLLQLVGKKYLQNLKDRASKNDNEQELLLFAEQFKQ
ncbi:MAG: hypothetical protein ACD_19C00426G0129 [uncultured bacterium]|nr:MAG: hypothetical protein ACD_19C00426G0129 [uncultured bacterium]